MTREPEMVKAFRDTWHLGVHSYLSYLRDRVRVARDLLADSGSVFVPIGDENMPRVSAILDEVFGPQNRVSVVTVQKTTGATTNFLPGAADYLLWYAKDITAAKFRSLVAVSVDRAGYRWVVTEAGNYRAMTAKEANGEEYLPENSRVYIADNITSQSQGRTKGEGAACWFPSNTVAAGFCLHSRAVGRPTKRG